MASAGDLDLDRVPDILVGAPLARFTQGEVHLFSGRRLEPMDVWSPSVYAMQFGSAIARQDDLNGDRRPESVVTAPITWGTLHGAGWVETLGLDPYMRTDAHEISVAAGGTIAIEMDFPDWQGGWDHKVLFSASGAGVSVYGVEIPLEQDPFVVRSFLGIYPPVANPVGLHGTLDSLGRGQGTVTFPPGALSSWVGRSLHLAAVAIPPGFGRPQASSAVAVWTFVP